MLNRLARSSAASPLAALRRRRGRPAVAAFSFSTIATRASSCVAVVDDDAVDVRALDDRVGAERVVRPDDDVGVLADFERADAVVDAELLRGIERHHRERLVVAESPHRTDLAASVLSRRACSALSELIETFTPLCVMSAALPGIASSASIL